LFGPTPAHEYAPAGPRAAAVLSKTERMQDLSVAAALASATRLVAQTHSVIPPKSLPQAKAGVGIHVFPSCAS
jgi:hypothetical protein